MDAIDFSGMKTSVALRLGNMQTGDPFYTTELGRWVNEAGNRVILRTLRRNRRRPSVLFPELYDYWEDITIDGQDYLTIPGDVLWVDAMYHYKKTGTVDMADDTRYNMTEINDNRRWQFLSRSSTPTGYPTKWHRYGNRIYIHPTPSSSYLTKTLMTGFAQENTLSGDTDTFAIDPLWHPAIIDYAVSLGATAMGWTDDAKMALESCDRKIAESLSVTGRENASNYRPMSFVINDPTS